MSINLISASHQEVSPAEAHVLQFFRNHLGRRVQGWEIYIKPYLNGISPSFVLMNPRVGIAIFQVAALENGGWSEHPLDSLNRAKTSILSLYCPRLAMAIVKDPRAWALISTNLVVTDRSEQQVSEWYSRYCSEQKQRSAIQRVKASDEIGQLVTDPEPSRYRCVRSLHDVLQAHDASIFPSLGYSSSKYMSEALASSLRSWLAPEPHPGNLSSSMVSLDDEQQRLARERDPLWRRVRGPAGSGKSLTLAARAANHARGLDNVLVLTFNITLWHYIRTLAHQFGGKDGELLTHVEWNHFHQWCIDRCLEAGLGQEYNDLWHDDHDEVLSTKLPTLTQRALDITGKRYDAVVLDEAQDFDFEWWKVIRTTVKRPGGRVFLVADRTQDLFDKAHSWRGPEEADEAMSRFIESNETSGTGFRTDWFDLKKSYRLPFPLIRKLREYASDLLPSATLLPDDPSRGEIWPCVVNWTQVDTKSELPMAAAAAVREMYERTDREHLPLGELVVLTSTREMGQRCVASLGRNLGLTRIQHTFADPFEIRVCHELPPNSETCRVEVSKLERLKKIAFVETVDTPRVTTIKSFKGWEARAIVVVIEPGNAEDDLREVYVALSRVKADASGSYITVVCAEPSLSQLQFSWNFRYP